MSRAAICAMLALFLLPSRDAHGWGAAGLFLVSMLCAAAAGMWFGEALHQKERR